MQATVSRISQTTHVGTNGKAEHSYVVQFNVGDHGPFTITVPQAQFTEPDVRAKLKEVADKVSAIHAPGQP